MRAPLLVSSLSPGSSPPPDGKQSEHSQDATLRDPHLRFLPLVWQIGGTLITVAGYIAGTNTVVDTVFHIALLSFATGAYLSLFIRDRRRPQDTVAIIGYFMYAAFLGLVSAPSLYEIGPLASPARTLALLCGGFLLSLTWLLFVEYLID